MAPKPIIALLTAAAFTALIPAAASGASDGIKRLITVTQMKSGNANDTAMNGADKQRKLIKAQKNLRASQRKIEMLQRPGRTKNSLTTGTAKASSSQSRGLSAAATQQDKSDLRIAPKSADELNMIRVQDVVNQRNKALTTSANIVKKTNCKECIKNIK
jgi:hypothetical protein